jgi:acyl-CoA dehydrogenase
MRRDIFTSDHEAFRDMVRSFIAAEVAPYHEQWERDGCVSREVWLAAGKAGLLGIDMDDEYGGGGNADYRYYLIMNEELARAGAHGPGFSVHNDINGQYLQRLATAEQRERWLPGYCSGEIITAIAMSVDRCVQLFGGYGYMREYPVARAYLDSRVQTIFGGTTEIQKEIIGRGLGL